MEQASTSEKLLNKLKDRVYVIKCNSKFNENDLYGPCKNNGTKLIKLALYTENKKLIVAFRNWIDNWFKGYYYEVIMKKKLPHYILLDTHKPDDDDVMKGFWDAWNKQKNN